jgi:DNA-binding CsgD family transcriptional regulator
MVVEHSESGSGVGSDEQSPPESAGGLDRVPLDALVRDVALCVSDKHDPQRLQTVLVETLAATGRYAGIWVGNRLNSEPTEAVGDDDLVRTLGRLAMADSDRDGFEGEGRVTTVSEATVQSIAETTGADAPRVAVGRVPLQALGLASGMLVVATRREEGLPGAEQSALADIGRLAGFALDACVSRTLLVADGEIEVVLALSHDTTPTGLTKLASACEATVELERMLPRHDGAQLHVTVPDADRSLSGVADGEVIERSSVFHRGSETCTVELVVPASSPLATFAASGVAVTAAVATSDRLRLTVQGGATGTEILREFQAQYPSVTCLAKRQVTTPTAGHSGEPLLERADLTAKQQTVLEVALSGGFFERPRRQTGQELAETLDISASTFHQHLRDGLRKVIQTTVEG